MSTTNEVYMLMEATRWAKLLKAGKIPHTFAGFRDFRQYRLNDAAHVVAASGNVRPMDVAMAKNHARTLISGRHLARASDEVVIPSGITAEQVGTKLRGRVKHLFRGKDFSPQGPHFTSAHPDVAAGYATGRDINALNRHLPMSVRRFRREGVITAHRVNKSNVMRVQSAGSPRGPDISSADNNWNARHFTSGLHKRSLRKIGMLHQSSGFAHPTYETLLRNKPLDVAGKYSVRMIRTRDMKPAWAMNTLQGIPAKQMFRRVNTL